MAKGPAPLVINDLRGGRNDVDPPSALLPTQAVECLNVDFWRGTIGNKRGGAVSVSTAFSAGGPFTANIGTLIRHVPGNDETAAELWAFGDEAAPVVGRLAASTSWVAPTNADTLAIGSGHQVTGASLNGMLHLGFPMASTGVNRFHAWDPSLSKIRKSGMGTPAAPTATPDGGTGLSFTRYYRVRYVAINGAITVRRSEASAVLGPETISNLSGVTITKPASISENETHWELEAADTSTGIWYRLAQTAVATTTFDDTNATIPTTTLSPVDGINVPLPAARYVISNDNRLILAGCFETSGGYTAAKNTRVWWTPVLGSTDVGDAERIPNVTTQANFADVEAAITGLGGPINGIFYVFAYRRIWKFVPTGLVQSPYQVYSLTSGLGCIDHRTIAVAEDEDGLPCLYWLSHRGLFRYGAKGLQYCGRDIETLWGTVNLGATIPCAQVVWYSDKHQLWWAVATGTNNEPDTRIVFDTKLGRAQDAGAVRYGWTKHTGAAAAYRGACLFSNTLGASMSRDLKPYLGMGFSNTNQVWKADTGTDDAGTPFQAYVDTAEYAPAGNGFNLAITEPFLQAAASSGVTMQVTAEPYYGGGQQSVKTVSLTPDGSETRLIRKVEGLQTAGYATVRYRIGDASAVSNSWTLDSLTAPFVVQDPA